MASVTYTAKRNLASGHSLNTQYYIDFTASVLNRTHNTRRMVKESLSGRRETIRYTGNEYYDVTANEVTEDNLQYWREFLESVNGGETFTFDPYGTYASPDNQLTCDLDSDSYQESRIDTSSYYNISFRVRVSV